MAITHQKNKRTFLRENIAALAQLFFNIISSMIIILIFSQKMDINKNLREMQSEHLTIAFLHTPSDEQCASRPSTNRTEHVACHARKIFAATNKEKQSKWEFRSRERPEHSSQSLA